MVASAIFDPAPAFNPALVEIRGDFAARAPAAVAGGMEAYEWWCERFTEALESHVAKVRRATDGLKQGSPEWLALKERLVGGSELAVLLGQNPYQNWESLVAKKLDLLPPDKFGVACWWGTMLEPVTERFVELDCDTPVLGTDIHIRSPSFPDHANSPDGYCIASFVRNDDGEWALSHDPRGALAAGRQVQAVPALIELKAPYRRKPTGRVPRYYVPQVQSGLVFSPDAALGLFVETVYRMCSLGDLGPTEEYSKTYHKSDQRKKRGSAEAPEGWGLPCAWGATAVYAPYVDSEFARGRKGAKASLLGMRLLSQQLGYAAAREELGTEAVDIGEYADISPSGFDDIMECINTKKFKVRHSDPRFGSGRLADVDPLTPFLASSERDIPEGGYYLLGYIPWKIFRTDYHIIHREEGFAEKIRKLTAEFMADVRRLRAHPKGAERREAYQTYCAERMRAVVQKQKESGEYKSTVSGDDRAAIFAVVRAHTIS